MQVIQVITVFWLGKTLASILIRKLKAKVFMPIRPFLSPLPISFGAVRIGIDMIIVLDRRYFAIIKLRLFLRRFWLCSKTTPFFEEISSGRIAFLAVYQELAIFFRNI